MTETEMIEKIKSANIDELNEIAYKHNILIARKCQTIDKSSDMDLGRITIEICARKKMLSESEDAGNTYRDYMLARHYATAAEFADLSVQDGIITQKDADDLKTNPLNTLNRLFNIERKVDFKWLTHFTNKYNAEHPSSN